MAAVHHTVDRSHSRSPLRLHLEQGHVEEVHTVNRRWSDAEDPVLCHRCDSHGCVNPHHLRLGIAAENRAEWAHRRRDLGGPLADVRGAVAVGPRPWV